MPQISVRAEDSIKEGWGVVKEKIKGEEGVGFQSHAFSSHASSRRVTLRNRRRPNPIRRRRSLLQRLLLCRKLFVTVVVDTNPELNENK